MIILPCTYRELSDPRNIRLPNIWAAIWMATSMCSGSNHFLLLEHLNRFIFAHLASDMGLGHFGVGRINLHSFRFHLFLLHRNKFRMVRNIVPSFCVGVCLNPKMTFKQSLRKVSKHFQASLHAKWTSCCKVKLCNLNKFANRFSPLERTCNGSPRRSRSTHGVSVS